MNCYQNIDMIKTGKNIEKMIRKSRYDVSYIQSYLQLSCPQPIYRWFKGQILPTVDHLYMLSKLLKVHMEDLLVQKQDEVLMYEVELQDTKEELRWGAYINILSNLLQSSDSPHPLLSA